MQNKEPNEEDVVATFTPQQVKLAIIIIAVLFALVLAGKILVTGSAVDEAREETPTQVVIPEEVL